MDVYAPKYLKVPELSWFHPKDDSSFSTALAALQRAGRPFLAVQLFEPRLREVVATGMATSLETNWVCLNMGHCLGIPGLVQWKIMENLQGTPKELGQNSMVRWIFPAKTQAIELVTSKYIP